MKEKLIAMLLVAVMVASAFGAIGLSATKVGAAGESLTLSSTSYSPSSGQQYALFGLLTDGSGNPLANKPIDIFYHYEGAAWQFSNTIYTGADGKYSTTASSSQTVYLQTGYKVGGVYVASSNVVTINVQSTQPRLTLSSTSYSPSSGQQYTLSGYLRDSAGKALANKPIDIFYHFPGAGWQFSNTIYTGADGKYSTTASSSQTVYLQTGYKVGGVYVASSNVVTINVQEKATTTTISASSTNPLVNETVTFTVNLKTGSTGLSKSVKIWHTDPDGTRIEDGTKNTVNGVYKFSLKFASKGQRIYHAEFAVDSTYGASSGTVTVNVQPIPTRTTISVSKNQPAINEQVTFTAALKKRTVMLGMVFWDPIPSQSTPQLKIVHYENSVMVTDVAKTTDSNGKITWTTSWPSTNERTYYAYFEGDTTYAASLSAGQTVTPNAKTSISLGTSNFFPHAGSQYTLSGTLKDSSGHPLANKEVYIWSKPEIAPYTESKLPFQTDASGNFSSTYTATFFGDPLTGSPILYWAEFVGDGSYLGSNSKLTMLYVVIQE